MKQNPSTFINSEQITPTVGTAALTVPPGATFAILKPRAPIYLSLKGVATSSNILIDAGTPVELDSGLADVRLLQVAAGAVVDVLYFG